MNVDYNLEKQTSTIEEIEFLHTPVSMFANAYEKTPMAELRLSHALRDIHRGRWKDPVTQIRTTFNSVLNDTAEPGNAKKAIDDQKKSLPAFCMSGTAETRTKPLAHSGFLQIDLDNLDDLGQKLPAIRKQMQKDPHVAFGFVSPSGHGLKLGLRIDGDKHAESFEAAQGYFLDRYGLKIDKKVKDKLRLCFVSYDLHLWANPDAVIFDAQMPAKNLLYSNNNNSSTYYDTTTLQHYDTTTLHTLHTLHNSSAGAAVSANIKAKKEALKVLETKHPQLAKLYSDIIEPKFQALPHTRNAFIVDAVPFLYRVVCPAIVLELIACFYDCHRALFNDSREQHMAEAQSMLESVAKTYAEKLNADEHDIYGQLDDREKDAFRVCRDLALLPNAGREPMTFFISYDHLAARIGIFAMQAQRIMRRMEGYGLLKQLKKGTARAKGVPGEAGSYHWLLPCESKLL